jgi:D-glycero-D-manno-heptose 1,7-bisphosphate phosphatase
LRAACQLIVSLLHHFSSDSAMREWFRVLVASEAKAQVSELVGRATRSSWKRACSLGAGDHAVSCALECLFGALSFSPRATLTVCSTKDRSIQVNSNPKNSFHGPLDTVLLDRDGVVNEKMPEGSYVTSWDEFQVLPGVLEAIRLLNQSQIRVIVVSNQRGVALGRYTAEDVQAIHAQFQKLLQAKGAHVDGFFFCPHDKEQCNCRKPLPGMFDQAVSRFPAITTAGSVMIGDSKSDMEFGRQLGITTVLIEGQAERQKSGAETALQLADLCYSSLYEAVNDLLARIRDHREPNGASCQGSPA